MLTLLKPTRFFLFLFLFCCLITHAQNPYRAAKTGFASFNFGATSLRPPKYQTVSLFGCNTSITDSILTQVPYNRTWKKADKLISGIPCGWQIDNVTKDSFYVSKYYIASPPIMKEIKGDTIYDIGLVIPDEFEMIGDRPSQMVYMNYDLLKKVYIEYLPVEFDTSFKNGDASLVPFLVECINFPWLDLNGIRDAKGASGIGYLNNNPKHKGRLFLPYYYERLVPSNDSVKVYLDCQVTILNDILFHYEVFFKINESLYSSVNLKDYKDGNQKIQFVRRYKKELPCGCKEPERARLGPRPYPPVKGVYTN